MNQQCDMDAVKRRNAILLKAKYWKEMPNTEVSVSGVRTLSLQKSVNI